MESNALMHIWIELCEEKTYKTSGGNMNKVLEKRRELIATIFFITIMIFSMLSGVKSYAAVGDVVKEENQRYVNGVKYPANGSTIKSETTFETFKAELYSDNTLFIAGTGSIKAYYTKSENQLTKLSGYAGIKTVILGEGVTGGGGSDFFAYSPNITTLYLNDTVPYISMDFENLKLENVRFSDNITNIGVSSFYNSPLSGGLNLPKSLKTMGKSCFKAYALNSVTLPEGVEVVNGFSGTKLTKINLPDSVVEIGESAFDGTSLVEITGGKNVKKVGNYAFRGAKVPNLEFNSLEDIGAGAFYNISSTLDIDLSKLKFIGDQAFYGVGFPSDFMLSGTINTTTGAQPFTNSSFKNVILEDLNIKGAWFIKGATIDSLTVKGSNNFGITSTNIKSLKLINTDTSLGGFKTSGAEISNLDLTGSTLIGDSAFNSCKLGDVIIPESIKSIGNQAFSGSTINSIKIPESVNTIGVKALSGTTIENLELGNILSESILYSSKISNLKLGNDIAEIPASSFYGMTLKNGPLDLSTSTATSIGNYGLNLSTMTIVKMPEGITRLGTMALKNVDMGDTSLNLNEIKDYSIYQSKTRGVVSVLDGANSIPEKAFYGSTVGGVFVGDSVKTIGKDAFSGAKITSGIIEGGAFIETIESNAFAGSNIVSVNIPSSVTSISTDSFNNCLSLKTFVTKQSVKFNTSVIYGCTSLTKLVILSDMDSSSQKSKIPATTMVYCVSGSTVETWCMNNSVSYKALGDEDLEEIVSGKLPTLKEDSKMFDFASPIDLKFKVTMGVAPSNATSISKLLVDNKTLVKDLDYTFNGSDTITIKSSYLKKLYNGVHAVSVLFSNGTFKSGASIYVMSSTIPVIDPTKPPQALDTVKYEFYKDYPDYLIIPVSLNGATSVTKLKIGSEVVDPDEYYIDDGAIVISYGYLSTLDAGKYRILPTFDDPSITTLNNIQLWVYENAADRAAPYLLQTRIIFRGQNFELRFDAGVGDLETSNVLALVIDNQMLLPDGRLLPLSASNVSKVKKNTLEDIVASPSEATRKSKYIYTATPEGINTASPSEATNQTMSLMSSSMHVKSSQPEEAFYVVDNEIHVSGNAISSMKLAEGDHLMGAVFDNTEKTSDVRKVILSIMSDKDNGTETPGNNAPPENNNGSNNEGNSGSEGNLGSGSHGSSSGGSGDSSNGPGAKGEDSKVKPVVRDDGGSYNVNPNDSKDVTYTDKAGNLTPNKWVGDGKNWRHTNKDSKLDYGWFLDVDGNWYLLTKETGKDFGTARYGWFHENQDGKWYYLSTKDNKMVKGKVKIDGKDYNFNATNQEPTYYGNNINGWIYDRTKGLPVGCWMEDI